MAGRVHRGVRAYIVVYIAAVILEPHKAGVLAIAWSLYDEAEGQKRT